MIYRQIAVRLPRLLDKDLNEVRRLRPRAQSIEMNIAPLSTASMTLDDGSGVAIRSFVELFNAKGSAGIFRVSAPDESYGSGERIALEHGICVLDDAIVPGQGEIKGTPRGVLEAILTHQTAKARGEHLWTLGAVEAPAEMEIAVEHDGTKTLEMLAKVMRELQGYMLTFDQSGFPWVVNVVKKPEAVACEGRLSRNIRTIRKTQDASSLCTRLYCSLLDGGYIESDTIGAWGEVEENITLNDDMPKEEAAAYCRRYLDNRKNPVLAIELDAQEWYAMTGERLDRFENGDICRLALPDYGVAIEERIVAISYMDAMGSPELATVSLANQVEDMSIKSAKTQQDVDDLKNTSTNYGNRLSTSEKSITNLKAEQEGIKEINGKMTHWFSSVEVDLDATEEAARFGALASHKEITSLDVRMMEAELTLYGDGTSAQAGLAARVSNAEGEISRAALTLYGDGTSANAGLTAKVGSNEASIQLHADGLMTLAQIKADKVELGKYATVERLEAELAEFELSLGDSLVLRTLNVTGAASTDSLNVDNRASVGSMTVGGTNLKLLTKSVLNGNTTLTVNSTGGTVTGVTLNRRYTEFHYLGYE